jgi:membrane protein required for colicin V production
MNWLDIVLAIILIYSVVLSFRKGLTREVVGLVSVVLALLLGIWFYGAAGSFLLPYVSSRMAANFAGFFIVFCGVMLAGGLVSFAIGKFLKVTGLSIFDHALGAAFGVVRGVLIAVALIMGILAFSPGQNPPDSVVHSRTAPYVIEAAHVLVKIAPHDLKEGFHRSYAQVKSSWASAVNSGVNRRPPEAEQGRR